MTIGRSISVLTTAFVVRSAAGRIAQWRRSDCRLTARTASVLLEGSDTSRSYRGRSDGWYVAGRRCCHKLRPGDVGRVARECHPTQLFKRVADRLRVGERCVLVARFFPRAVAEARPCRREVIVIEASGDRDVQAMWWIAAGACRSAQTRRNLKPAHPGDERTNPSQPL